MAIHIARKNNVILIIQFRPSKEYLSPILNLTAQNSEANDHRPCCGAVIAWLGCYKFGGKVWTAQLSPTRCFCWGFDGPKQTLLGMFGDEGVENLDNILDHHLLGGHAPLIDGQANLFP